jgi:hypothetical protein
MTDASDKGEVGGWASGLITVLEVALTKSAAHADTAAPNLLPLRDLSLGLGH